MSGAQSPQTSRPVGITKGPGETIHEYTLISSDEHRLLKNGEYVYYELDAATDAAGPWAKRRKRRACRRATSSAGAHSAAGSGAAFPRHVPLGARGVALPGGRARRL